MADINGILDHVSVIESLVKQYEKNTVKVLSEGRDQINTQLDHVRRELMRVKNDGTFNQPKVSDSVRVNQFIVKWNAILRQVIKPYQSRGPRGQRPVVLRDSNKTQNCF